MRSHLCTALVCVLAIVASGCRRDGNAASQITQAPDYAASTGQAKCGVKASSSKPLVVEWPAADRAALEARANRGLVAVRYEGCDMEVLLNCTATGSYGYLPLTPKRESVKINNADELYANLPVGAFKLEAKLARDGQLNVDMVIIGRKEADTSQFTERELTGRCDQATHVITGLTVGAFSFYTGASAEIGAGVAVGNIGAGAKSQHGRELINSDGDESACQGADPTTGAPPTGCGALLRVEVEPIDRIFGAPTTTVAPSTGGGTSAPADTSRPTTTTVTADPDLERKVRTWRTIAISSYVVALGGMGVMYGGIFVYKKGKDGLASTDPGGERQEALKKTKAGIGMMAGGAAGMTLFLVAGLVATARSKRLQQQRTSWVAPSFVNGGAGLSIGGRF